MKNLFTLVLALMATVAAQAQQIAVVASDGSTKMYQTLTEAITGATSGSTIYLPGGGFSVGEKVEISKKVTIIGIGHKSDGENADGNTTISGNLFFNSGSSGSAVMGCYLAGYISIGMDKKSVNNILVRYCNALGVHVENTTCSGTVINRNYLRGHCYFHGASVQITNNVLHSIEGIDGGLIANNIITSFNKVLTDERTGSTTGTSYYIGAKNATISQNVINTSSNMLYGDNCLISGNMTKSNTAWGDNDFRIAGSIPWSSVFEKPNGVTPASNYHFKESYAKYENTCGIYAGTGFSDSALPPVPYIVSKSIPEQTDSEGKLNIKIRVKASE